MMKTRKSMFLGTFDTLGLLTCINSAFATHIILTVGTRVECTVSTYRLLTRITALETRVTLTQKTGI